MKRKPARSSHQDRVALPGVNHVDPLTALLGLVRDAAREGAEKALVEDRIALPLLGPLVDKRALGHALGISPTTVDRLCRDGQIPFIRVGDVRRFDIVAVRAALQESRRGEESTAPARAAGQVLVPGVRLLSRGR